MENGKNNEWWYKRNGGGHFGAASIALVTKPVIPRINEGRKLHTSPFSASLMMGKIMVILQQWNYLAILSTK